MARTPEEIEAMNKAKASEPVDDSDWIMDEDKMVGQRFIGKVQSVDTVEEYALGKGGVPLVEEGKNRYIKCNLVTDFTKEGKTFPWQWKYFNSKKGMHARVLAFLKNIPIVKIKRDKDGKRVEDKDGEPILEPTGDKGLTGITSPKKLTGLMFQFEKQDIDFGINQQSKEQMVKRDFPVPIAFIMG